MEVRSIAIIITGLSMLLSPDKVRGQEYKLEVNLSGTIHGSSNRGYETNEFTMVTAKTQYFFVPKISVGVFYSRSIYYNGHQRFDNSYSPDAHYQHYGVELRASTKRTKRFSVYGTAGILKAEEVMRASYQDFYAFTTARSGMGIALGFGATLKITRALSLNLIDSRVILYNKNFSYRSGSDPNLGGNFNAGLIYKFIRER
jgi:hypothetical protein